MAIYLEKVIDVNSISEAYKELVVSVRTIDVDLYPYYVMTASVDTDRVMKGSIRYYQNSIERDDMVNALKKLNKPVIYGDTIIFLGEMFDEYNN